MTDVWWQRNICSRKASLRRWSWSGQLVNCSLNALPFTKTCSWPLSIHVWPHDLFLPSRWEQTWVLQIWTSLLHVLSPPPWLLNAQMWPKNGISHSRGEPGSLHYQLEEGHSWPSSSISWWEVCSMTAWAYKHLIILSFTFYHGVWKTCDKLSQDRDELSMLERWRWWEHGQQNIEQTTKQNGVGGGEGETEVATVGERSGEREGTQTG